MYYPHVVQGGVGPYHPAAAPGFPQPPTAAAETLSVAVAVKTEQIPAAHKPDVSGPPPQTSGVQPGAQFSPPLLGAQPPTVSTATGQASHSLSLPVSGITNGIEQQTVSIRQFVHSAQSDLLQQTEPESGQQSALDAVTASLIVSGAAASVVAAASNTSAPSVSATSASVTSALASMAPISTAAAAAAVTTTLASISSADSKNQPKRLHVSNIPFRFRDPDLRAMFGQYGTILDVEIIFNERGSKGFGFVTFANSSDAERARERLHGTVVEGRKIEVNNATARVQTKKTPTVPPVCVQWPDATAALRGVAIQRGRARAAFPAAAAAAAAFARLPAPLAAAAGAANALHGYTPVYYDPFLAAAAAQADPNYRLQAAAPLLKTPLSQAQQQAYSAAAATYTAVAGMRAAYGAAAAAAAQPVAGYAAVAAGYGREYADPYLGHGIGPVPGYGAAMYRGSYNRFTPY